MAFILTPMGKTLALKHTNVNDPEDAVICYLYEHNEPIEVDELAGELRTTEDNIMKITNRLLNMESPFIKEV